MLNLCILRDIKNFILEDLSFSKSILILRTTFVFSTEFELAGIFHLGSNSSLFTIIHNTFVLNQALNYNYFLRVNQTTSMIHIEANTINQVHLISFIKYQSGGKNQLLILDTQFNYDIENLIYLSTFSIQGLNIRISKTFWTPKR